VSGLGYVNLLHVAVTLAAIPDPTSSEFADHEAQTSPTVEPEAAVAEASPGEDSSASEPEAADSTEDGETARGVLEQARAEAESEQDSFFTTEPFHATVVVEEPEAHLHPQLQHSLVRYLRRVVSVRPELQVVLSSHASDVISACDPLELVVMRRAEGEKRMARTIATIPMSEKLEVLRKARLHLDTTRSAALFGERVVFVEGVTDAAVLREFGLVWAAGIGALEAFIDALAIVSMGTRVGSWPVRLLGTKDHEISRRIAVLKDSDLRFEEAPEQPSWLDEHDPNVVGVFFSHPTLEPATLSGNEEVVRRALADVSLDVPSKLTPVALHEIFRSARKETPTQPATPAGPGARLKGEYALALALADHIARAREAGEELHVPDHFADLFAFVAGDSEPSAAAAVESSDPGSKP
jgi:putative ATP-dependent endonuclease of the OLD family